jgi:hypothetical protein
VSQTIAPPGRTELNGLTWQKVILGDWTPVIRDPLDVARIAFIVATIVWISLGHAWTGLVGASLVILFGRAISLPRFYDASVIFVMFLLAWGSALSWYGSWGFYDNLVHFLTPLMTTGMFYLLLVRLDVMPEFRVLTQVHHRVGFFLMVTALGPLAPAGRSSSGRWTRSPTSDGWQMRPIRRRISSPTRSARRRARSSCWPGASAITPSRAARARRSRTRSSRAS